MRACWSHVEDGSDPQCPGFAAPEAEGPGGGLRADTYDYLLAELERLAARPTREDMLARLHSRKRVTLKTRAAAVIREERESA